MSYFRSLASASMEPSKLTKCAPLTQLLADIHEVLFEDSTH